jgi:hypothetical protein
MVADTANHVLRGVELATGTVRTVAGSGRQWMRGDGTEHLSSPWDIVWYEPIGRCVVAMAGIHQLWTYDPVSGATEVWAGTSNEGLVDGPLAEAWFAQTSGLAVSSDGAALWLADAETSSLRRIQGGEVRTVVGAGLFDFGHRDGRAGQARLQHPLGVAVLPDGSVAVLDTYNDAVRRYDPSRDEVTTLLTGMREPSGAVVADGDLVVVESAAHRLTRLRLPDEARHLDGPAQRTQRPTTEVGTGELTLDVVFTPPPGQKLDERDGPATRLLVSTSPPELLASGAGGGTELRRRLVLADGPDAGVLHVSAMAASCDTEGEYPACHVHQQDWGVPVRVSPGGRRRLALVLLGPGELDQPAG